MASTSSSSSGNPDFFLTVGVNVDEDAVRRGVIGAFAAVRKQLKRDLVDAIQDAFQTIDWKVFVNNLRNAGKQAGQQAGETFASHFAQSAQQGMTDAGKIWQQFFARLDKELANTKAGYKKTFTDIDPDTFDSVLRSLRAINLSYELLTQHVERANDAYAEGRTTVEETRRAHALLENASRRSGNVSTVSLQSAVKLEAQLSRERAVNAQAASQQIIAQVNKERAVQVTQMQAAAAAQKMSAQQRLAIMRSLFNQLRALERGIASTVKFAADNAARAVRGAFSALGSMLTGLASRFRQSDARFGSGLDAALRRREGALRGHLSRQEAMVRQSMNRQMAIQNQMQQGVLGSLNRSGLLGPLAAGGVGFLAWRSVQSSMQIGGDFVQGLAVLGAQLDLTDSQMQKVREQALALGNDITLPGVSALDAAQAIQLLAKQFGSLGDAALPAAQNAAKGVLQLSRAVGVESEEAARVVGAAVNVFGIEAEKATIVADQVAAAMANAAGVGFNEFAEAFTMGASVFKAFQEPAVGATGALVEFNTALAALAKGGLVGSDAGTALKQFFLQGIKQTDAAKEKMAELTARAGEVGTAFFRADGSARPLSETLDILRRGLAGYSDEQRTATLQTLFGSDAFRVAEILTSQTSEAYEKLRTSIAREGVAAKLAAAQNTGLRGALDALRSVIETVKIQNYEKVQGVLGQIVLKFAELFNQFYSGQGAWKIVRTGLMGIAAGMAAIIAARGAVEVIKLLGVAARFAMGPFALLVATAGAAAGAFALLRSASPEFKAAIDNVTSALGDAARRVLDQFGIKIGSIPELIGNAIVAFGEFIKVVGVELAEKINWLAERIVPAAISAVRWLRDAFKDVVAFVERTVIPMFNDFAETARRKIGEALTVVGSQLRKLADFVRPVLGPVMDVFYRLFEAIKNLDWRAAFEALKDGPGAIKQVFGTVVQLVKDSLLDLWNWMKRLFTAENLLKVLGSIGTVIRDVAYRIAKILSDPKVFQALGAIAAVGVFLGSQIVVGLIQGVASNIPELAKLLGDVLVEVVELAVETIWERMAKLLPLVLAGVLLSRSVLIGARRGGDIAGQVWGDGFKMRISQFPAQMKGYFVALFGGAVPAARMTGVKAREALVNEIYQMNIMIKALGGKYVGGFGIGSMLMGDLENVAAKARQRLSEVAAAFTPAQIRALAFRQLVERIGVSFRLLGMAAHQAFEGRFKTAVKTAGASLESLKATVQNMGAWMRVTGTSLGSVLGGSLAAAAGAAFSGQMLGRSSGFVDTLTSLSGLFASAGIALAAGGPIGPALAAGTVAIGAVTAALTAQSEAAKRAKAEIGEYVDAMTQARLANEDLANSAVDVFLQNIADEGEGVKRLWLDLGLNVRDFVKAATQGGKQLDSYVFSTLSASLKRLGVDIAEFGISTSDELVRAAAFSNAFQMALADAGIHAGDLVQLMDLVGDEGKEALKGVELSALNAEIGLQAVNSDAAKAVSVFDAMHQKQKEAIDRWRELNQQKISGLEAEIERGQDLVETFKDELDKAYDSVRRLFEDAVSSDLDDMLRDAVLATEQIPQQVAEAAGKALSGLGPLADASMAGIADKLAETVGGIIEEGVKDNTINNAEDAMAVLQPLFDALTVNPDIPEETKTQLKDTITGVVESTDYSLLISKINGLEEAIPAAVSAVEEKKVELKAAMDEQQVVDEVERALDAAYQATSTIAKEKGAALGSDIAQGVANGISGSTAIRTAAVNAVNAAVRAAKDAAGARSPARRFIPIGEAMNQGLAVGIEQTIDVPVRAMQRAVTNAAQVATGALRPAERLGMSIGESIIAGIESSLEDLPGAVEDVLTSGFAQANARAAAAGVLFGATMPGLPGGATRLDLMNASVGAANAFQTFFDQVIRAAEEAADAASDSDKGMFKSWREFVDATLDLTTQVGRENYQGVVDALSAIREQAEAQIAAGASAREVTSSVRLWRDSLIDSLESLGFNREEVLNLVAALGLADDQLGTFEQGMRDLETALANAAAASAAATAAELWRGSKPGGLNNVTTLDVQSALFDVLDQLYEFAGKVNGVSLSMAEAQGRINIEAFIGAAQSIFDYGAIMLQSGTAVEEVIRVVMQWRDTLMQQATALGFNTEQLTALLHMLGLTDEQLKAFIETIRQTGSAAAGAAAGVRPGTTPPSADQAKAEADRRLREAEARAMQQRMEREMSRQRDDAKREVDELRKRLQRLEDPRFQRNIVQNITMTVPYSDPEAVALAAANRLALTAMRR